MTLNYKDMVKHVDRLVNNDFCASMEMKLIPDSREYSQLEAKKMANIISKVYSISHCRTCVACQHKYIIKKK